jgi:tetratricopeptide (TPR) repeat protein
MSRQWLAVAALLALSAAPAAADKADELFARGKAQLARKQYAQACVTFEQVDALDPGIGAKLNVAKCYQEWGKLASAYRWYADAEDMAARSGDKRAPKIKELLAELEPDVPRLTIRVPKDADLDAAAVKLDGELITSRLGRKLRVDPGPHVITYRVDGEEKSETIAIERGGTREVKLVLSSEEGEGSASARARDEAPTPPDPGRPRRLAGFALMGAAAASLGVAGYLSLDARSDYRAALDAHCKGAKDMCNDEGLRITGDARSRANVATVFALVGVAAAAGGIALYLTAPSSGQPESLSRNAEALYLAPAVGDRAGLLLLGGRF